MWNPKLRINRRAVSPIIATLLLVAIAVAAAVVTYTWVMSMAANQSQQSQTSIKIDQVLFGQVTSVSTSVSPETTVSGSDTTTIKVEPDNTAFQVNDYVKVTASDGTVLGVSKVTTATDGPPGGDSTLVVNPALSSAPAAGATVSLVAKVDGALISLRNIGSIATTIQSVYIYKGDALIATANFTATGVSNTVPTGTVKKLAITPFHDVVNSWSQLTSGGKSLPDPDTGYAARTDFALPLEVNTPYRIRIVTSTGFTVEGTYYTPGSWS